jgi:hypothetical protein
LSEGVCPTNEGGVASVGPSCDVPGAEGSRPDLWQGPGLGEQADTHAERWLQDHSAANSTHTHRVSTQTQTPGRHDVLTQIVAHIIVMYGRSTADDSYSKLVTALMQCRSSDFQWTHVHR